MQADWESRLSSRYNFPATSGEEKSSRETTETKIATTESDELQIATTLITTCPSKGLPPSDVKSGETSGARLVTSGMRVSAECRDAGSTPSSKKPFNLDDQSDTTSSAVLAACGDPAVLSIEPT